MNRLRELKEKNLNSQFWDPDIPREWQSAMNHMFHKGQMIAVKGEACKVPATESPDAFCMATAFAPDYPQDVPRIRWDHEEVYDPDPESWRNFKSYCKHGSFMDGIELFDCKMFSMSPNEARPRFKKYQKNGMQKKNQTKIQGSRGMKKKRYSGTM